jgi:acylglycerol lipase
MKHTEGTFKSVHEAEIYYQGWLPEGVVKATLFLVHGLGEHSGRYGNVVEHFVPQGYAIYGLDHIGHGKSSGEREVVNRFEDYLRPLETYYGMVKGWQPDKPIILYGHSMGGLISCVYLLDHQADFQGALFSAPAIKISESISPMTITLSKILSTRRPDRRIRPSRSTRGCITKCTTSRRGKVCSRIWRRGWRRTSKLRTRISCRLYYRRRPNSTAKDD